MLARRGKFVLAPFLARTGSPQVENRADVVSVDPHAQGFLVELRRAVRATVIDGVKIAILDQKTTIARLRTRRGQNHCHRQKCVSKFSRALPGAPHGATREDKYQSAKQEHGGHDGGQT